MKYANGRAAAIDTLRIWAREEIEQGAKIATVHFGLMSAMQALIDEFRVEHDVPGVRYWCHPESDSYFTTLPGEDISSFGLSHEPIELLRYEFLSRQDIHFGYEQDRL